MTPRVNHSGYHDVNLSKNGASRKRLVHRLVAEAFIPNTNGLPEINHKDENKLNNSVDNLEWCSHVYNMNWGHHNENVGRTNGRAVSQFTIDGKKIGEYYSSYEAHRVTGITEQSINLCCLGRRQHAGMFRWRYTDDNTEFAPYRPRCSAVVQCKEGEVIRKFKSIKEANFATGINNISACCRGVIKTAGGYNWRYEK